jgi:hypothetical protein
VVLGGWNKNKSERFSEVMKTWKQLFDLEWNRRFNALSDEGRKTVLASPQGKLAARLAAACHQHADEMFEDQKLHSALPAS